VALFALFVIGQAVFAIRRAGRCSSAQKTA
jgi:hypothetical protein